MKNTVVIGTNNQDKVRELSGILASEKFNLISLVEAGITFDVDEPHLSLKRNSEKKAMEYYNACKLPVISEDSGLFIDALDGMPGVFSKRWMDGSDDQRNIGILENMQGFSKKERRTKYVCYMSYYDGEKMITVKGECRGYIDTCISGDNGFAYDKIFVHTSGKKISEMTEEEKGFVSHRVDAAKKLFKLIK